MKMVADTHNSSGEGALLGKEGLEKKAFTAAGNAVWAIARKGTHPFHLTEQESVADLKASLHDSLKMLLPDLQDYHKKFCDKMNPDDSTIRSIPRLFETNNQFESAYINGASHAIAQQIAGVLLQVSYTKFRGDPEAKTLVADVAEEITKTLKEQWQPQKAGQVELF